MTTLVGNNSVFKSFFEKQKLTGPNFIDWYKQLRLVLSTDDKENYLEHPILAAPVAPPGQLLPHWRTLQASCCLGLKCYFSKQAELGTSENVREFHICKRRKALSSWKLSKKRIEKLQHDGLLNSIDIESLGKCVSCLSGKMARKPYSHQVERAKDLLGLIHTDVFQKEVENQLGKTIKSLRSDRGGEYMSQEFLDHLKEHGIIAHRTPPYTPQNNGVSERRNRTLLDMVRSMMSQTTLPKSFWDYALETAARILNMVPSKKVDKTPYEIWHGQAPKLSYLRVWGCEAFVKHDTLTKPDKLDPRSYKCIFVGYPKETMGYSFYSPSENKVFVARNAEFFESKLLDLKASGSVEDLEEIQEEDTNPSVDTSLNHEEDDQEIDEPQSDINPIRSNMSNLDELRHTDNTTLVPPRLPDTLLQVYHRRRPTLGLLILPSVSPFSPTIRRTARISFLPTIELNLAEHARIFAVNLDDYQLDHVTLPPSPSSPFTMAAYQRMINETDPTRREEALTAYGTETGQNSVLVPKTALTVCTTRLRGGLHTILEDMDHFPNSYIEELEAFMTLWDVKPRVEECSLEALSVDELIT
ncbi:retrotransposon protein, putative, ty1-copia subclass [Tanacetum coccineum]